MKSFFDSVYEIVEKIPAGYVTTYGEIAKMLGRPRMARFVGFAMNNSKHHDLPWHRVTFLDGRLWDGEWEKVQYDKLSAEGITFLPDGHIDVKKHLWKPNHILAPEELRDLPIKF